MLEPSKLEYRILGLSALDRDALIKRSGESNISFEEPERSAVAHNELATIVVTGGFALLTLAAGYLFGKRRKKDTWVEAEVVLPNGGRKALRVLVSESSTEPVDTQVSTQVLKLLDSLK